MGQGRQGDHRAPGHRLALPEGRDGAFTPLHAFIGPNDSGKSTLLLPKDVLRGAGCSTTEERVAVVDGANLAKLPDDARSLGIWLERAATASKG